MLSVVPVAAAPTDVVGQTFELRLVSGTIISGNLHLASNQPSGGVNAGGQGGAGFISLTLQNAGNAHSAMNAFGILSPVQEFVPAGARMDFSGIGSDEQMPWQAPLLPVLDPISPVQPGLSPLRLPTSGPVFAPVSIAAPTSMGATVPVFGPFAGSTSTTTATLTASGVGDVASSRWLSATFSPSENVSSNGGFLCQAT